MKTVNTMIAALLIVLVSGCLAPRAQSGFYQYNFQLNGEEYQIISATNTGNGKFNLLVHETPEALKLRAVDYEQDGRLDSVIVGDISLEMANIIYAAGITTADAKGSLNRKKYHRLYELDGAMVRYRIQTFIPSPNKVYNRFSIFDFESGIEDVIMDKNADGVLDRIEVGRKELSEYQKLYEMTLIRGENEGEIRHQDALYKVIK